MQVTVKKWGNSASLRIPAAIMERSGLKLDDRVEIREEQGLIIVQKVAGAHYDIDQLVAGITEENLHRLEEDGPVGGEVW